MSNFNQKKYIQEYNKEHYKTFKVDLKKEELEELNQILKEKKKTKAQFLREAIENIKNEEEV
jgi:predicted DNA-binding protein